ncbi:MAG: glutamate synthase [Desulfomonile tiedjei]|uniref:Glutamate synthase n=1 Tax=Desulfomonile tiedjei TaxID=2358 RepID=A0A9D6UXT6_9BACT|nr:glutamate synthase [Desulfomonile tiedjei]
MKHNGSFAEKILAGRIREFGRADFSKNLKAADEGGCGVTGFACNIPVAGKHIFEPSIRMHNRGNGKGGGIAAVGFNPDMLGVSREVLDSHYMLNVALLEPSCLKALKEECVTPFFNVAKEETIDRMPDWRELEGLEVKPPDVWRAFVRVKPEVLKRFIEENGFQGMTDRWAEDEFVSRNSVRLNKMFYASLGDKQAFVMSHGRNVMILKIVGYAENVVRYYKLEDFQAHVWIAHQRYPTRGRVWHPGGAHPFTGLNEALVHNGDFANYHATCDYLKQRGLEPQFMTDTEVSIMLFDLWNRVYGYPLEVILEALAPTGELDFDLLPPEKQALYDVVQQTHIHASPDGPWFFIIARNIPESNTFQLLGITDTSMLRPQVFSLYDGEVQVGLVCSEKQAIDATLRSLAEEDPRFSPVADKYWNARGGSRSDGGAFMFNVTPDGNGGKSLACYDKFGRPVEVERRKPLDITLAVTKPENYEKDIQTLFADALKDKDAVKLFDSFCANAAGWDYNTLRYVVANLGRTARRQKPLLNTIVEAFTLILDRRFSLGEKKRSALVRIVNEELNEIFRALPKITDTLNIGYYSLIDAAARKELRPPIAVERALAIDAKDFEPEGDECDSVLMADAYRLGWRKFVVFDMRGQRFHGCGFGSMTSGVRMDLYGSSGDYEASGIDGMEIHIHGNAQDQIGQIMKSGLLVIHGDVGQCFMYGAKGGTTYILGNTAGRPLINAAGHPRVVINGTSLDFLAESFMAGDPLNGGGFVIVNGLTMNEDGGIIFRQRPYPGSNLFSLASGGALYMRDPNKMIVEEQLNGGALAELSDADWNLIYPYLLENEKYFGIKIDDLLTVDGVKKSPKEVYRKVEAVPLAILRKIPSTDDSVWAANAATS